MHARTLTLAVTTAAVAAQMRAPGEWTWVDNSNNVTMCWRSMGADVAPANGTWNACASWRDVDARTRMPSMSRMYDGVTNATIASFVSKATAGEITEWYVCGMNACNSPAVLANVSFATSSNMSGNMTMPPSMTPMPSMSPSATAMPTMTASVTPSTSPMPNGFMNPPAAASSPIDCFVGSTLTRVMRMNDTSSNTLCASFVRTVGGPREYIGLTPATIVNFTMVYTADVCNTSLCNAPPARVSVLPVPAPTPIRCFYSQMTAAGTMVLMLARNAMPETKLCGSYVFNGTRMYANLTTASASAVWEATGEYFDAKMCNTDMCNAPSSSVYSGNGGVFTYGSGSIIVPRAAPAGLLCAVGTNGSLTESASATAVYCVSFIMDGRHMFAGWNALIVGDAITFLADTYMNLTVCATPSCNVPAAPSPTQTRMPMAPSSSPSAVAAVSMTSRPLMSNPGPMPSAMPSVDPSMPWFGGGIDNPTTPQAIGGAGNFLGCTVAINGLLQRMSMQSIERSYCAAYEISCSQRVALCSPLEESRNTSRVIFTQVSLERISDWLTTARSTFLRWRVCNTSMCIMPTRIVDDMLTPLIPGVTASSSPIPCFVGANVPMLSNATFSFCYSFVFRCTARDSSLCSAAEISNAATKRAFAGGDVDSYNSVMRTTGLYVDVDVCSTAGCNSPANRTAAPVLRASVCLEGVDASIPGQPANFFFRDASRANAAMGLAVLPPGSAVCLNVTVACGRSDMSGDKGGSGFSSSGSSSSASSFMACPNDVPTGSLVTYYTTTAGLSQCRSILSSFIGQQASDMSQGSCCSDSNGCNAPPEAKTIYDSATAGGTRPVQGPDVCYEGNVTREADNVARLREVNATMFMDSPRQCLRAEMTCSPGNNRLDCTDDERARYARKVFYFLSPFVYDICDTSRWSQIFINFAGALPNRLDCCRGNRCNAPPPAPSPAASRSPGSSPLPSRLPVSALPTIMDYPVSCMFGNSSMAMARNLTEGERQNGQRCVASRRTCNVLERANLGISACGTASAPTTFWVYGIMRAELCASISRGLASFDGTDVSCCATSNCNSIRLANFVPSPSASPLPSATIAVVQGSLRFRAGTVNAVALQIPSVRDAIRGAIADGAGPGITRDNVTIVGVRAIQPASNASASGPANTTVRGLQATSGSVAVDFTIAARSPSVASDIAASYSAPAFKDIVSQSLRAAAADAASTEPEVAAALAAATVDSVTVETSVQAIVAPVSASPSAAAPGSSAASSSNAGVIAAAIIVPLVVVALIIVIIVVMQNRRNAGPLGSKPGKHSDTATISVTVNPTQAARGSTV